jgi:hypothetical protein
MGYRTYLSLSVHELDGTPVSEKERTQHENGIAVSTEDDFFKETPQLLWATGVYFRGLSIDEIMKSYSKRFPNYVFSIHGEGDESGDFWYSHYCQGRMQYCPVQLKYKPCRFFKKVKANEDKR